MHDVCCKFCCLPWVPWSTELNMKKDLVAVSLKIIIWNLLIFWPRKNSDSTHESVISGIQLNATMNGTLSQRNCLACLLHVCHSYSWVPPTTKLCKHVPLHSSPAPGSWWRLFFQLYCQILYWGQEGLPELKGTCIALLSFSLQWHLKTLKIMFADSKN